VLVLALGTFLVAGCRTDVTVDVDVAEDGSGTVTATLEFDAEAASAVLDLQRAGLALEDLFQAGWQITPPTATENGSIVASATKAFGTPAQFSEVMAELTGDGGLVSGFTLTRSKSFATVDYVVEGTLRPDGLEPFADPELLASLGRPLTEIADGYGATPAEVSVTLRIGLPGTIDPAESGGTPDLGAGGDPNRRIWTTRLDAAAPTSVVAVSSTREVAALVWRGVAVVAGVLAVLVAFGHLLRVVRPERRRGSGRGTSGPPPKPKPKPKPVIATTTPSAVDDSDQPIDEPVVVALDGMGVLYREGDDINQLLVPFVRSHGSDATHDQVVARARAMSLGRITPADFWKSVGVDGEANRLDDEYLSLFHLNPGVVRFMRYLRERGVRVACVTNDSTVWATKLRARHSLEGLVDPWIVSGAVGVRKPDRPIYEVLRRVTGVAPEKILVVDDDLDNLDAARSFGFQTAWFAPDAAGDESRQHVILRSFEIQRVRTE
jgi:putative hydrolase of the HAD superfamily